MQIFLLKRKYSWVFVFWVILSLVLVPFVTIINDYFAYFRKLGNIFVTILPTIKLTIILNTVTTVTNIYLKSQTGPVLERKERDLLKYSKCIFRSDSLTDWSDWGSFGYEVNSKESVLPWSVVSKGTEDHLVAARCKVCGGEGVWVPAPCNCCHLA